MVLDLSPGLLFVVHKESLVVFSNAIMLHVMKLEREVAKSAICYCSICQHYFLAIFFFLIVKFINHSTVVEISTWKNLEN